MIHFLNTLLLLCIGPIILTPIIPEIIGLPPTNETAYGKISSNQGFNIYDKTIDIPLKTPKKQPNAINNLM
jgi:hypothetical protein